MKLPVVAFYRCRTPQTMNHYSEINNGTFYPPFQDLCSRKSPNPVQHKGFSTRGSYSYTVYGCRKVT